MAMAMQGLRVGLLLALAPPVLLLADADRGAGRLPVGPALA